MAPHWWQNNVQIHKTFTKRFQGTFTKTFQGSKSPKKQPPCLAEALGQFQSCRSLFCGSNGTSMTSGNLNGTSLVTKQCSKSLWKPEWYHKPVLVTPFVTNQSPPEKREALFASCYYTKTNLFLATNHIPFFRWWPFVTNPGPKDKRPAAICQNRSNTGQNR